MKKDPSVFPIISQSTLEIACDAILDAADDADSEDIPHVADELRFLHKVLPKITTRPDEALPPGPKITIEMFEQFTKVINEFVGIKDDILSYDGLVAKANAFRRFLDISKDKSFNTVTKQLFRFAPESIDGIFALPDPREGATLDDSEDIDDVIVRMMEQFVETAALLDEWRHKTADERGWPASFL